jgi:hypothetical protein
MVKANAIEVLPAALVALTLRVNVPAVADVPLRTPDVESVNPDGTPPGAEKLIGGVPVAINVNE